MSWGRYPAYRESGVEWIGRVPAHWPVLPLKRAARLVSERADGRSFPVALENIEGWSGRFIETEGEFEGDGIAFIPGDILFGKLRPYLAKAWLAHHQGEAVGDIHVLRPAGHHVPAYVQSVLLTREVISLIDGSTYGAKMPRVGWDFMGSLPVPLPPPDEQAAIAAFLDRETGRIDALVAEQERLIALLKEKRQAVISHAVTRGLNRNAPMKDSGVAWLGEVPAHWEVKRIKHLARLESGHTPSKQSIEYWAGGHIDWVSLNDTKYILVNDFITSTAVKITEAGLANSSARLLPAGTVIFTRDATVGLAAILAKPMAVSQHIVAWCTHSIDEIYLLKVIYAMKNYLDANTSGATLKTIGMPEIKRLITPVPPLQEQRNISASIEIQTGKLNTLTTQATHAIALLRERRAALISAAVTGRIDVRDVIPAPQAAA